MALGQGIGDFVGTQTERSKTDTSKYKRYLKQQEKDYNEKNTTPFHADGLWDMAGLNRNSQAASQTPGLKLEFLKDAIESHERFIIGESTSITSIKDELADWLGNNIHTPEQTAQQFLRPH